MEAVASAQHNPSWEVIGRRLRAWCRSPASYTLLDASPAAGGTWTAGGCALLAVALARNGVGALRTVIGRSQASGPVQPQHWIVQVPGGFLDADGFSTGPRLLVRLRDDEFVHDPEIRQFQARDRAHVTYKPALDVESVAAVQAALRDLLQPQA